jgi:hypothetical protein
MVSFQTKNPNLGKFWRAQDWKMLIYFKAIWNISQKFGIFYDHLVHFVFIWYIFSGFGIMYQEKSGNPGVQTQAVNRSRQVSRFRKTGRSQKNFRAQKKLSFFIFRFFSFSFLHFCDKNIIIAEQKSPAFSDR